MPLIRENAAFAPAVSMHLNKAGLRGKYVLHQANGYNELKEYGHCVVVYFEVRHYADIRKALQDYGYRFNMMEFGGTALVYARRVG